MSVLVKICGITRMEDAEWAIDCGANALGFVHEPSSPRCVAGLESASSIPHRFGLFARCVAVFAALPPKVAIPYGYAAVQATEGDNFPENHWAIRAIRTGPDLTIDDALAIAEAQQAILVDAFDPVHHGGTGKVANWEFASELVRATTKSVLLAGGLTPDNVVEAIHAVRPFAVDVSSGVESAPGVKDKVKVKDFIDAVRSA